MDSNETPPTYMYTYKELLATLLIQFAGGLYEDEWIFQQDNAPIHTARETNNFLSTLIAIISDQPGPNPNKGSLCSYRESIGMYR